ncbi:MAG: class II aldolase/adducin family protein [Anaerolineae bacterium]|nr:class II aldolase/adducin family protein [Anaerolineae bacterium]
MSLESRLVNLAAAGRKLVEHGLVRGSGGNLSLRWEDLCYITPTGARLDRLSAGDFVPLKIYGPNTWQLQRASSEHAMHLACYRTRPDAATVFHVHPPNCIALAAAGLSLPALTPDLYLAVGPEVPLLPYITPTTQALADAVAQALSGDSDAVLLRNHGLVLIAASTDEALVHTLLVEDAAYSVLQAYAAAGTCSFLTAEQMAELERVTGRYRRRRATE